MQYLVNIGIHLVNMWHALSRHMPCMTPTPGDVDDAGDTDNEQSQYAEGGEGALPAGCPPDVYTIHGGDRHCNIEMFSLI